MSLSANAFIPDPLLSRAAPQGHGGFGVLDLLMPAPAGFRKDPLLDGQAGAVPLLASPATGAPDAGLHGAEAEAQASRLTAAPPESGPPGALPTLPLAAAAALGEDGHPPSLEAQAWQDLLSQQFRLGFEQGLAQGAALGRDAGLQEASAAAQQHHGQVEAMLGAIVQSVRAAGSGQDAAQRYEPLKRLALHLAAELVRQELTLHPALVERLVERCVRFLQPEGRPVVVELNPMDLALLREQGLADRLAQEVQDQAGSASPLIWRDDAAISRGSVRARCEESTVEDLIEHRLASLVRELQVDAARWQADHQRLHSQVGDANPDRQIEETAPEAPKDEHA